MQARLRSDRIHAAAVASLVKHRELMEAAKAEREAENAKEVEKLLRKKTWCGGYKYNQLTARDRVGFVWDGQEYFGGKWYNLYKKVSRLETLVENTSVSGKPFPILLNEKDYDLIWKEL